MALKEQKIGIWGLGKTGISVYRAFVSQAAIVVYDDQKELRDNFATLYGSDSIKSLFEMEWYSVDKIILSPGVSLDHPIVQFANQHDIPIISDIDLLFLRSPDSDFIAITGTNGKSTTTSLISHILNLDNHIYPAVGNIGIPVLHDLKKFPGYVLELSSFQLDIIKDFTAKIAVLLNITPDHLDRHKSMEVYIAAKSKIFARMNSNSYGVINIGDSICREIFFRLQQQQSINLIPFSVTEPCDHGVTVKNGKIYDNFFTKTIYDVPLNKNLQGIHNYENIAAAYIVAKILGLNSEKTLVAMQKFQGLPHRMQYIGNIHGINFYNDSKATNAESATKSIAVLDNIYWLAGGIAKGDGIKNFNSSSLDKIKKAYFFGQAKEMFARIIGNSINYVICENLEEAFMNAYSDARSDSAILKNILLAPACSSYDQFKNFEERGELFIKLFLNTHN